MAVFLFILTFLAICQRFTVQSFHPDLELRCYPRQYTFIQTKNFTVEGEVLPCSGFVTVYSCYGRCVTSEVADYKIPYKISDHKVCTYGAIRKRIVPLTDCHPLHPEPYTEVFDATYCSCKTCSADTTSCENLNG